jgi:hypothetical protein
MEKIARRRINKRAIKIAQSHSSFATSEKMARHQSFAGGLRIFKRMSRADSPIDAAKNYSI